MAFLFKTFPKLNANAVIKASISTVQPKKLEHFGELAKIWWESDGRYRALHKFVPFRVEFMAKHLMARNIISQNIDNKNQLFKGIKVLDMGCGAGLFTERLGSLGATVTGVDPSPLVLDAAWKHLNTFSPNLSPNITYINETAEEHVMNKSGHYDIVVAFLVLEHIQHRQHFLKDCFQLLKPGGSIFLQTINKHWLVWCRLQWHKYTTKLLPKNILTYSRCLNKQEVIDYLHNLNCESVDFEGLTISNDGKSTDWTEICPMFLMLHAVKQ